MVWCHQSTSHYLNQFWPRFMSPYYTTRPQWVNSLGPGRYGSNFKSVMFKLLAQISRLSAHCEIALRWMPENLTDAKWTLVQATSHHLSQCWSTSMLTFGITSPQWGKGSEHLNYKKWKHKNMLWIEISTWITQWPIKNLKSINGIKHCDK